MADGMQDLDKLLEETKAKRQQAKTKTQTRAQSAKHLFPLQNKYLKKIRSLNAQGKTYEAKGLMRAQEARLQQAAAPNWIFDGVTLDRYEAMRYIAEQIGSGRLLKDIAKGKAGAPSMSTVLKWAEDHPAFGKALEDAKKVQAAYFADLALERIVKEEDEKKASLRKNQHDALMKRASLQSADFRERQPAPPEKEVPKDIKEMQAALAELLKSDLSILPPDLAAAVQEALNPKEVITVPLVDPVE